MPYQDEQYTHLPDLFRAINDLPVNIVYNPFEEGDMAGSVRTGLGAVHGSSNGILVSLADHPLVSSETVSLLISRHQEAHGRILIPRYRGAKGHPSLFPRELMDEIFEDTNLREIIGKYYGKVSHVDVVDEGVVIDVDTAADYERLTAGTGS